MIQRSDRPFSANERMLDAAIRHAANLERLSAGEVKRILDLLNTKVIPDLVEKLERSLARIRSRGVDANVQATQQYKDLIAALDEIVRTGMRELGRDSNESLFSIARHEAAWQARTLAEVTGPLAFEFELPDAGLLRSIVTSRPMQGHLLKDWWSELAVSTRRKVQGQLNIGIAEGESVDDIVRRIHGTRAARYTDGILQQTRHSVRAIVRTAVKHVTSHATQATLDANADLIKGQQLHATLDLRTTDICIQRDGNVYELGKAPPLPFHWGERSVYVALLKSWKELGIPLKDAPPGTRASMDGQVPSTLTYWDWLKTQSVERQNAALGPGRAALFRAGKLKREQLVDAFGNAITLQELEALESAA